MFFHHLNRLGTLSFHGFRLLVADIFAVSVLMAAGVAQAQEEPPVILNTQIIKAQSPTASDWFGNSMAIDGGTTVINAVGYEADGRRVLLYSWQAGKWNYFKPVAPEILAEDDYGPVEIDGDILLISESRHDGTDACTPDDICGHSGRVLVFERNLGGEDNWGLRTTLDGGHKPSASFGSDVQIDGDTIIIAAFSEDVDTEVVTTQLESSTQYIENVGAVYIFERDEGGENQWGLYQRLEAPSPTTRFFGAGLKLAANQLVLGWGDGFSENILMIYERGAAPEGGWGPVQEIQIPISRFTSHDFDGTTLVVTTYSDTTESSQIQFFERGQSGEFELQQTNAFSGGGSLMPSVDHGLVVVQAREESYKAGVFAKNSQSSEWDFVAVLDIEGGMFPGESGGQVALDSGRALVGITSETNDREGEVFAYDLSMFLPFGINAGLNDAWYNRDTVGQGFLISAFPVIQQMFVAWFTFDTQRPPEDVTALLGEPGHRWLTAQGPYSGDTAELTIYVTEGGVFDSIEPAAETDLKGDGTLTIEFADCTEALVSYEITSLGLSGQIPVERIVPDNVELCESLQAE